MGRVRLHVCKVDRAEGWSGSSILFCEPEVLPSSVIVLFGKAWEGCNHEVNEGDEVAAHTVCGGGSVVRGGGTVEAAGHSCLSSLLSSLSE